MFGITYSPSRKSFVSKSSAPLKAELYADLSEMKALATLVGPYGIKLIDREILKGMTQSIGQLKVCDSFINNSIKFFFLKGIFVS